MAISGISDCIQVLKETSYGDGGSAGEKVFGDTQSFTWSMDTQTTQYWAVETGSATPKENIDGVINVTGTHTWLLTDGREFEAILGTVSDDGSNYNLSQALSLPSYAVRAVEDSSNNVLIKGIKYTRFSINISRDSPIEISADYVAQMVEDYGSAVSSSSGTYAPLNFTDGVFQIDASNKAGIDNVTIEIDRAVQGFRFIQDVSAGDKRQITDIIEGPSTITYNGAITVARSMLQEIYGSTTLQDTRTDGTVSLNMSRGDYLFELDVAGTRMTTLTRELIKDQEVSLYEFEGVGREITGHGSY